MKRVLLLLAGTWLASCQQPAAPPATIWDLAERGVLDFTNQEHPMSNGVVDVDIDGTAPLAAAGLGSIGDGREAVNEINLRYRVTSAQSYWLHVTWQPGGSGTEQYSVACNGSPVGESDAVEAADSPYTVQTTTFEVPHKAGSNVLTLGYISGDGLHFKNLTLTTTEAEGSPPLDSQPTAPVTTAEPEPADVPEPTVVSENQGQLVKPTLEYPTLESYESARRSSGVLLKSQHVWLFAPKSREREAKFVFPYLKQAYDALYAMVGVDTEYVMTVYHFPDGGERSWGGTSNCTIWYGDSSLDLDAQEEWTKHHVPHVSGYIEEMAHNFVAATRAQFGWEMMGWSLGIQATRQVADNPSFEASLSSTRNTQRETYERYMAAGKVFPNDIAPNLVDRLHGHILGLCEAQYGPTFWPDVFKEIRRMKPALDAASLADGGDEGRNARYTITVDCFDRLPGLQFEALLRDSGISRTVSVKSLHPTEAGWNRRLE